MKRYCATARHVTEYPSPIMLFKGDIVTVGEIYSGPENWDRWYFCTDKDQTSGWVPEQIIRMQDNESGLITEDYTARELNIMIGDILMGLRSLNGWLWAIRTSDDATGWVPLNILKELPSTIGET